MYEIHCGCFSTIYWWLFGFRGKIKLVLSARIGSDVTQSKIVRSMFMAASTVTLWRRMGQNELFLTYFWPIFSPEELVKQQNRLKRCFLKKVETHFDILVFIKYDLREWLGMAQNNLKGTKEEGDKISYFWFIFDKFLALETTMYLERSQNAYSFSYHHLWP